MGMIWYSCLCSWCLFQPERINPDLNQKGYSVKSDIWSLGITMVSSAASHDGSFQVELQFMATFTLQS